MNHFAQRIESRVGVWVRRALAILAVVTRELGPMLINFIVIVHRGSAMMTELGILNLNGETRQVVVSPQNA